MGKMAKGMIPYLKSDGVDLEIAIQEDGSFQIYAKDAEQETWTNIHEGNLVKKRKHPGKAYVTIDGNGQRIVSYVSPNGEHLSLARGFNSRQACKGNLESIQFTEFDWVFNDD